MRPSIVTDRSQISSQTDPRRWETGQAGDKLVWPSSAGVQAWTHTHTQQRSSSLRFHTRLLGRSYMNSAACALIFALTHEPSQKTDFHCGVKTCWQTCLVCSDPPHTHTHKRLMIYIIVWFSTDMHQMAGGIVSPDFSSLGGDMSRSLFV